jgi:hypothetical protein
MTYVEKLDQWLAQEREAGRIVDLKLFPVQPEDGGSPETMARAVYETLTGVRESTPLDVTDY